VEIAQRLEGGLARHPVYSDCTAFYLQEEEVALVQHMRDTSGEMAHADAVSDSVVGA
jgi:hypothetical protein